MEANGSQATSGFQSAHFHPSRYCKRLPGYWNSVLWTMEVEMKLSGINRKHCLQKSKLLDNKERDWAAALSALGLDGLECQK